MNLVRFYIIIIIAYFIIWCFQIIPWSDYILWYWKDSVVENFQYLLMIFSFMIFVWSSLFLAKNFLQDFDFKTLKTQIWKLFFLSFWLLVFFIIQFWAIRLMMDSWVSFVNMQMKKQIPVAIKDWEAIYANPQPTQVLNKN